MEVCTGCGHALGVGRFCTNCGQRIDHSPASDSTTEHGAASTMPPAVEAPPHARYPLFADDIVERGALPAPPTGARPAPPAPPAPPEPEPTRPTSRRARRSRAGWLPWMIGVVALILFAMIGALLLLTDDDGADARDQTSGDATAEQEPTSRGRTDRPRSPKPTDRLPAGEGPVDLARYAAADVPDTAPPNVDVSGNQVRYEAENMLDGVAETCWRMPGSGGGDEIVFTFQEPVELTEVGLINGYAKTSGDLDWYHGNRRVLDVEWVFDDDTNVEQTLDSTRQLQSLPIDPIATTTVTLRLLEVSDPGRGRSARNYTAISDVSLVGELA